MAQHKDIDDAVNQSHDVILACAESGCVPSEVREQQHISPGDRGSSPGSEVPRGPASWHAAAAAASGIRILEPSLLEVNLHEDESAAGTWQEKQQLDAGGSSAVTGSLLPQVERLQQQLTVEKHAREVRRHPTFLGGSALPAGP